MALHRCIKVTLTVKLNSLPICNRLHDADSFGETTTTILRKYILLGNFNYFM